MMKMIEPGRDGKFEGDKWYGFGGVQATHEWRNGVWSQLVPAAPPAADEDPGLPEGMGAIPADMPNSAHADVSLEYTLQNFNALVAANTAMMTEISAFPEKETLWKDSLARADAQVAKLTQEVEAAWTRAGEIREDLHKANKAHANEIKSVTADLQFVTEQRDANQRRLDRALGYVDRMLDDEETHRSPETRTVPAPKPPIGPNLHSIPEPFRKAENGASDHPFAFSRTIAPIHGEIHTDRPRRY